MGSMIELIINSLFYETPYQKVNGELRYLCGFCGSEHKKFYVNQNTGAFICYNCGVSGANLRQLVSKYKDISTDDAQNWLDSFDYENPEMAKVDYNEDLYTNLNILMSSNNKQLIEKPSKRPDFPTNVKLLYKNLNNPETYAFQSYLQKRGVTLTQIKIHKIGYIIKGSYKTVDNKQMNIENSVIFVTYWNNNAVYWNTRSIFPSYLKTINAPAKEGEFSRRDVVFNLNNLLEGQNLVICEGVFNALTADSESYCGVATFGKNISEAQLSLIASKKQTFNNVIIALDNDVDFSIIKKYKITLENKGIPNSRIKYCFSPYKDKDFNDIGKDETNKLLKRSKTFSFGEDLLEILNKEG